MLRPSLQTLFQQTLLLFVLAGLNTQLSAQTATVTYNLENVSMIADVSHPWSTSTYPMTGTFEWTYVVGDFDNGNGVYTAMDVPWYGTDVSTLDFTIDLNSIEMVLPGNWQNLGLDITMHLIEDLSPTEVSNLDLTRSAFDIENNSIHKGHFVSGRIVPDPQLALTVSGTCPSVTFEIDGAVANGQVALLYAFGGGAYIVPNGYPCAGTWLGLDSSVTLGVVQNADASGTLTLPTNVPAGACGQVYLQALDLTSCGLSNVILLQ
mgnify:CR=1 FL=1